MVCLLFCKAVLWWLNWEAMWLMRPQTHSLYLFKKGDCLSLQVTYKGRARVVQLYTTLWFLFWVVKHSRVEWSRGRTLLREEVSPLRTRSTLPCLCSHCQIKDFWSLLIIWNCSGFRVNLTFQWHLFSQQCSALTPHFPFQNPRSTGGDPSSTG